MERGDTKSAETLLTQAISACPTDPEARRRYAELLLRLGHRQQALTQLSKALEQSPDDVDLWIRVSETQRSLGQLPAARDAAAQALALNSKSAPAWLAHGRTQVALARTAPTAEQSALLREALADFHRALGYEPENRETLFETADAYRQLGEPQRALANWQALADTYPPGEEPQNVLYAQGLALLALNRTPEALDVLNVARDRAPPTPELLMQLAEVQLRLGQEADARQSLADALAVDPGHAASRALLDTLSVARQPGTINR